MVYHALSEQVKKQKATARNNFQMQNAIDEYRQQELKLELDTVPYTGTAVIYTTVPIYDRLRTVRKKLPKMIDGMVNDRTDRLWYNTGHSNVTDFKVHYNVLWSEHMRL